MKSYVYHICIVEGELYLKMIWLDIEKSNGWNVNQITHNIRSFMSLNTKIEFVKPFLCIEFDSLKKKKTKINIL